MACIVMASIVMAYTAMVCIVMAHIAMTHIAMVCVAISRIVMAHIVMALQSYGLYRWDSFGIVDLRAITIRAITI